MNTTKIMITVLALATVMGCASAERKSGYEFGMLSETTGRRLPSNMTAAVIYEIDGQRVFHGRGTHRVAPGRHTLRVWPEIQGPPSATPVPGANAEARGMSIEPLTIDVKEGERYYIAAVVRRHRVFARDGESSEALGPWRTTVFPVVIQDTET